MDILTFNISGNSAFFKSFNLYDKDTYFTYSNIHKIAILGILGAILGLGGHQTANAEKLAYGNYLYPHPEFYRKLKNIKISIVPLTADGSFRKKIFSFNNNCGYSRNTKGIGQNWRYKEQWLMNVSWDIYIEIDTVPGNIADKLIDYLFNSKSVFMPYLGHTNHVAIIKNVRLIQGKVVNSSIRKINSIFTAEEDDDISLYRDEETILKELREPLLFTWREDLPLKYEKYCCNYVETKCFFTNASLNISNTKNILEADNRNLYFL